MKTKIFVLAVLAVLVLSPGCRDMRGFYNGMFRRPVNTTLYDCSSKEKLKESLFEYFEIDYFQDYDKRNIDSFACDIIECDSAYTVEMYRIFSEGEHFQVVTVVRVLKRNCKIISYELE